MKSLIGTIMKDPQDPELLVTTIQDDNFEYQLLCYDLETAKDFYYKKFDQFLADARLKAMEQEIINLTNATQYGQTTEGG